YESGYRTHAEVQLASRKKVAKMLIAIVLLFAACYFPIHCIFIIRYTGVMIESESPIIPIFFMLAYWLCYFNSALNPLIYNFMSGESYFITVTRHSHSSQSLVTVTRHSQSSQSLVTVTRHSHSSQSLVTVSHSSQSLVTVTRHSHSQSLVTVTRHSHSSQSLVTVTRHMKFKKEFRNVFSCHKRQNTPLHQDSTWFNSTRMVRQSTSNSNHGSCRMLRIHDVTYPTACELSTHRVADGDSLANGDSV
ncbi:Orexin receptor type 1, partial [Bulinus truncatus]